MRAATNCSGLGISALAPTTGVKTGKTQNQQMFSGLPPKADLVNLRITPAASSWRTPPSPPRASARSRGSACGPRGARKLAPTRAARAAFSAFPAARLRCKQNGPFSTATKPVMPAWLCNLGAWLTHDAAGLFTFFLFLVGVGQAALWRSARMSDVQCAFGGNANMTTPPWPRQRAVSCAQVLCPRTREDRDWLAPRRSL